MKARKTAIKNPLISGSRQVIITHTFGEGRVYMIGNGVNSEHSRDVLRRTSLLTTRTETLESHVSWALFMLAKAYDTKFRCT